MVVVIIARVFSFPYKREYLAYFEPLYNFWKEHARALKVESSHE